LQQEYLQSQIKKVALLDDQRHFQLFALHPDSEESQLYFKMKRDEVLAKMMNDRVPAPVCASPITTIREIFLESPSAQTSLTPLQLNFSDDKLDHHDAVQTSDVDIPRQNIIGGLDPMPIGTQEENQELERVLADIGMHFA
jgi:hypothetical protein